MKWKSFGRRDYCINIQDVLLLICYLCAKYVTRLAKTGLITSVRNCGYSPFSSAKQIFVDFLFSSKTKS